jgi:pyridoxal phosphate enzyme (YggS family)
MSADAAAAGAAVAAVRRRIAAAGGDPAAIRLVAVTKGQPVDAVRAALAAGVADVGENYAQELVAKAEAGGVDGARWHFIGRLQRNKVRLVAPFVALWQSVDRLSLAAEIADRAPGAAVLLQVDVTGEEQKGGCRPAFLPALLEGSRDLGLDVRGLMAVGPAGPPEAARPGFRLLRDLADRHGLEERSMGMSGDLAVAVAEGATMVRIGTALFGERPRVGRGGVGE